MDHIDQLGQIIEDAAHYLDEDAYYDLVLTLDPDGSVSQELHEREEQIEQERRDRLSPEERADEDAEIERLVAVGMAVVQRILCPVDMSMDTVQSE